MSVLPFTSLFRKPAPSHPELPRNARELLGRFAGWAATQGMACYGSSHALWVKLPDGEVRVDFTPLLWPVMRPVAGPRAPDAHESDAAFLARQNGQEAAEKARLARQYPLDASGRPAWDARRGLAEVERAGLDPDATETDEVLRKAMADEPY